VGFNCQVFHRVPGDYSGPVSCTTELEALPGHALNLFLQLDDLAADVSTNGGDCPVFPATAPCGGADFETGEYVSFGRGGGRNFWLKPFLLSTDGVGSAFLNVRAISSVMYSFQLRTSWKP
jgi:hypothetical protein